MTSKFYRIPKYLRNNFEGYDYLISLGEQISSSNTEAIILDFIDCESFEYNLCAVLGSMFDAFTIENRKFFVHNMSQEIEENFAHSGFLDVEKPAVDQYQAPHFKVFTVDSGQELRQYVEQELLNIPELPLITDDLKKEIVRYMFEIYENARMHGECESVYCCGHIGYSVDNTELHFTLVDVGRTIMLNVNEYLGANMNAKAAIDWATSYENTTRVNTTGGLGLKLLQRFINNNGGRIQIVSSDGFWEFKDNQSHSTLLSKPFPGTIVNVIFNMRDSKLHYLDMEVPAVSDLF